MVDAQSARSCRFPKSDGVFGLKSFSKTNTMWERQGLHCSWTHAGYRSRTELSWNRHNFTSWPQFENCNKRQHVHRKKYLLDLSRILAFKRRRHHWYCSSMWSLLSHGTLLKRFNIVLCNAMHFSHLPFISLTKTRNAFVNGRQHVEFDASVLIAIRR